MPILTIALDYKIIKNQKIYRIRFSFGIVFILDA